MFIFDFVLIWLTQALRSCPHILLLLLLLHPLPCVEVPPRATRRVICAALSSSIEEGPLDTSEAMMAVAQDLIQMVIVSKETAPVHIEQNTYLKIRSTLFMQYHRSLRVVVISRQP